MVPSVSVVINTLDAARFLRYALASVRPWAAEIVVVDMHSADDTVAIARAHGARVLFHDRANGCPEPARPFAVAAATHPWVLVLDADELVPAPLSRRLLAVAARGDADAVRVPRLNHLLGGPLLHTGWNPERDRQLRFFRAGTVDAPTRVHEPFRARPGTRLHDLPAADGEMLVHFNYTDVDDFVLRLARYTSLEAEDALARGVRPSLFRGLGSAAREWLVRFAWHGGWRDGWRGRELALLMAAYRLIVQAKMASRDRLGGEADVASAYGREAERLLGAYAPPTSSTQHSTSPKCS